MDGLEVGGRPEQPGEPHSPNHQPGDGDAVEPLPESYTLALCLLALGGQDGAVAGVVDLGPAGAESDAGGT